MQNQKEKTIIFGHDTKLYVNEDYYILFDMKKGLEIINGCSGKPDPFVLILPSLLDIGIKGSCPNKCNFCYQGDTVEPDMSFDDFKSIIDQVKHHTTQVALGGRGDPETHKDFEKIVKYCRENNVVPNYTTSGQQMTDEKMNITKEYCGACAVSYYPYMKTPYYTTAKNMIEKGIKTNYHVMFTQDSSQDIFDLLEGKQESNIIVPSGLNAVIFLLFKPWGRGAGHNELIPTKENIEKFTSLLSIYSSRSNGPKIGVDSCCACQMKQFKSFENFDERTIDTCEGARMSAYISPTMKMIPCSFGDIDRNGISLRDLTIKEVWDHADYFKDFRKRLQENSRCPIF